MVVGTWEFMTMRSPLNFNGIEGIVSFLFGCLSKILASLHFSFHFVNYTQRGNNSTNACIYHSLSDVLFCSMSCRTSWYLNYFLSNICISIWSILYFLCFYGHILYMHILQVLQGMIYVCSLNPLDNFIMFSLIWYKNSSIQQVRGYDVMRCTFATVDVKGIVVWYLKIQRWRMLS